MQTKEALVFYLSADCINERGYLLEVWYSCLDPEEVSPALEAGHAVQDHPLLVGVVPELVQAVGHPHRLEELPLPVDEALALLEVSHGVHGGDLQEAVVLVRQVPGGLGDRDFLGEPRPQGVSPGHNDSVLHAELEEGVPHGVDLGEEVLVGDGDLTGLVTALLGVAHLVLHLDAAGTGQDHLLGQLVSRLLVSKPRINVGNDGDNVGLEVVDQVDDPRHLRLVVLLPGLVQEPEELVELPGVGLPEEGVDLLNEPGHGGFLVHALVREGPELGPHGGDHPARQVEIPLIRAPEMLLDGDHLLLGHKPVPAAEGLGKQAAVVVVLLHVLPHDLRGVLGYIETSLELVLQLHPRHILRLHGPPGLLSAKKPCGVINHLLVIGHRDDQDVS